MTAINAQVRMLKNNSVRHCDRIMPHFLWQTRLGQVQHPGIRPNGGLFVPLNDLTRTRSTPSPGVLENIQLIRDGIDSHNAHHRDQQGNDDFIPTTPHFPRTP